ncbi:hypothetical protein B0J11DRAFT_586282 [Dendryphion nanum]|uniref:FluG domain-containing protein n=1 Tax=Dendryphion nanum TaxID=256645 RepID=A0A9P9I6W7_9PLEO|nr:hypothetical protein B0J11DRAFT_586282 [Dendryphion nanum]
MEEEQENEEKSEEGEKELGKVISPNVTLSTSNFIKYELYNILELPYRKRLRRYGTQIHFLHAGTQWWKNDKFVFPKPRRRIEIWALIMACIFSTSRISEQNTIFTVFHNKCGNVEFAVQLQRDAKCMMFTPDKRPEHVLHEGVETRPLFCNPMLVIVAMCMAKNAFRDYESIDEVLALEPPGETASAFGRYLREWGFRAGYNEPPTVHDFRAEGLILTDRNYSQDTRMKQGGQRDPAVYRDHYAANNAGVDRQATLFHDRDHRTDIADLFRSLLLTRNPEMWQSLPAEKRHELEQSAEFKDIAAKLEYLSLDDALSKNKRKELQARKRKLISEALRRRGESSLLDPRAKSTPIQKNALAVTKPYSNERANSCRCATVWRPAILQDLIKIYSQEEELAFRPGLELEKCYCPKTGFTRKIDRYATPDLPFIMRHLTREFSIVDRLPHSGNTYTVAIGSGSRKVTSS